MTTPGLKRLNALHDRDLYSARVRRRELSLGFADLTDADLQQDFDIGAALPAGAIVLYAYVDLTATFTGGTISAMTCDIGVKGGDVDSIIDGADIFTSTGKSDATIGAKPAGFYGGSTLQCRVDAVGGNLDTADTGAMTIVILYIDPTDADVAS